MRTRDAARFLSMFGLAGVIFVVAVSCGGSGGNATGDFDASIYDGPPGPTFSPDSGGGPQANACVPKTCAQQGFTCGLNGDTCGGQIDCLGCPGTDKCGYGGYSKCGNQFTAPDGGVLCTPETCASLGYDCGPAGDGCGNMLDCGSTTCPGNEFCGGDGPSKCGGDFTTTPDGGPVCIPKTCADLGYDCGSAGDGCGGTIGPCGATGTCTSPQYCGGGGANKCGGNNGHKPDGGPTVTCTPKTCAGLNATCGVLGDGCGGTTPSCGTCTNPQFCGGAGPGKCGGANGRGSDGGLVFTCVPKTCATYGAGTCGQQSDGCGGLTANCGGCTNPQFCGGGGAGKCGGNNTIGSDGGATSQCKPATCTSRAFDCGFASDGCGGTIGPCGSNNCVAPQSCGGGGPTKPNVCGSTLACTGLCMQQVSCTTGSTTLTGTVVAGTPSTYLPAGVTVGDPVPNVLVYIPNGTPSAFTARASETAAQQCSTCGADVSGTPLVTTYSAYDGTFTLTNVPVKSNVPIVIQLGRWRRQFTVNVTNSCGANTVAVANLPVGYLVMPHNQTEGDIPLTAMSTGKVDAMECVLLKMGVDASEFTKSSGTGRIHLYKGNGANAGNNTPAESSLMNNGGTYNNYDQIILPCWGDNPASNGTSNRKTTNQLNNLIAYGDAGGHFFATHFSYAWLTQPLEQHEQRRVRRRGQLGYQREHEHRLDEWHREPERPADGARHDARHLRSLAEQGPGAQRVHRQLRRLLRIWPRSPSPRCATT